METQISRLPMVLALEEGYDRPSWWPNGRFHAETYSEQEVQPIFTMKDTWDLCACEGAEAVVPGYGQLDEQTGEELYEYIWCPVVSNGSEVNPHYRYDWRPGRELTEEQATRWALHHPNAPTAHFLFNGPQKEATASVHLPAANRVSVDGVDITQWVTDGLDIQLDPWQRAWLDNLPPITVTFVSDNFFDGGVIRASDGRNWCSIPVDGAIMENREYLDRIVRECSERVAVAEYTRGGREGGGADRSGSASEGTAE